ncbi:hypothetical protein EVAR_44359_1 [Eumeta japonica]|uniref:Uncharacterized protein n=1 Tax=Eumeta variegata TaxID=151549 RepID=A0A4C1X9T1_EUMVA|nr:hypothetical protein EVAR_44359_1 [Eumeta japonica]
MARLPQHTLFYSNHHHIFQTTSNSDITISMTILQGCRTHYEEIASPSQFHFHITSATPNFHCPKCADRDSMDSQGQTAQSKGVRHLAGEKAFSNGSPLS